MYSKVFYARHRRYHQEDVYAPAYDRDVHVCGLGHLYKLTESGLIRDGSTTLEKVTFILVQPFWLCRRRAVVSPGRPTR